MFLRLLLVILLTGVLVPPSASASTGWAETRGMATGRSWQTATLLPDGRVLVAGGMNSGGSTAGGLLGRACPPHGAAGPPRVTGCSW